jgi:hypothetical protein
VTKIQDNDKGVWVIGNARSAGSFSATVRLFTDIKDIVDACAFASNYPPVAAYTADYNLKFTGTPMYNLVLAHERGGTMTLRSDSMLFRPDGYRLLSFTDATGAPGLLPRIVPPPAAAASKKTWWSDDGAYAMSDIINLRLSTCANTHTFSSSGVKPEYMICDTAYFYNWHCLSANADLLCPDPWHIPTKADLEAMCTWWCAPQIPSSRCFGLVNPGQSCVYGWQCEIITLTEYGSDAAWELSQSNQCWYQRDRRAGQPVRCVITP